MARNALGVVVGLVVWIAVVTVAGVIMRAAWPAYASVADAMTFTLPMMIARLSIGAVATVAAGWVAATDLTTIHARDAAAGRRAAGGLHPAAHHALGEVPDLVSPDLSPLLDSAHFPRRQTRGDANPRAGVTSLR